jgi:hypothetical protein
MTFAFTYSALPLITGTPSLSDTTIAWSPSTLQREKKLNIIKISFSQNMYLKIIMVILMHISEKLWDLND